MAIELSLDAIKDMKKADFVKGFKNKAVWKKAKAVIILVDYKLDGKKNVIAIPFKKETEMKQEMKRLKKEKLHLLKKSGGGSIEFIKAADGSMEAKIEITLGGLAPEMLLMKGQPLFDKIKVKLQALQSAEAAAEAAEVAGEVDPNEDLPEDTLDDVSVDESEEEEENGSDDKVTNNISKEHAETSNVSDSKKLTNEQRQKFAEVRTKMKENMNKILKYLEKNHTNNA